MKNLRNHKIQSRWVQITNSGLEETELAAHTHTLHMGATAETIWEVPAYLPYVQPPLSAVAIAAAEEKIGHQLPPEYLSLLRTQNGGYIRHSLPGNPHEKIYGIGPRDTSLADFDWEIAQQSVDFPLKGLVPFDGAVHWFLCLDYRRNAGGPTVTYVEIDCNEESPVATSFPDYLSRLQIKVRDDDFILEGASGIENVKSVLSSALGVVFEPPDLLTYGYPAHRGRLGEDYLWLNANRVPRGFVRPEDEGFEELKGSMPGEALQFAEAPSDAYVLYVTESIKNQVLRAFVQSQIVVRPLRDYFKSC